MSPSWNPFTRRKDNPVAGVTLSYYGGRPVYQTTNIEAYAREAYAGNPDVYAAVEILAKACAGVAWYVEVEKGGEWQRTDKHPMLDLWTRPRPGLASTGFVGNLVRWRCIGGQFYVARNEKPSGPPRELWILQPHRMRIVPSTSPAEPIAGYEYDVNGRKQPLAPEMVLHVPRFHPLDDFYGLSPLAAAAKLVDQAAGAADYNLGLLQNGGIPPGFLKTDDELTDVQFDRFKEEMHTNWTANKAAGLPQLLEGGLDWKDAGRSPKDMEMLEAQRMFALKFAQVIGVPSEFLSGAGEKKYANYGEARKALYTEGALPELDDIRDAFNQWLAPQFGEGVRLCYDRDDIEALQEDRAAVWARVNAAQHLTVNEKREATGLEPIPEGDVVLVPFSLQPLGAVTAEPSPAPVDATPPPGEQQSKALDMPPDAKAAYWKRIDTQRERMVGKTQQIIASRLEDETRTAVKAAEGAPTIPAAEARMLRSVDAGKTAWAKTFEKVALAAAAPFAEQTIHELTQGQKAAPLGWEAFVQRYVKKQTARKVQQVTDTTKDQIKRIASDAVKAGAGVYEFQQNVEALHLDQIIPRRSEVIARTEVVQASNAGSIAGAQSTGLDLQKEWIATGDARTREAHSSMDGVTVALDEPFTVDGDELDFPGDSSHDPDPGNVIQCRCTVGYVTA